MLRGLFRTKDVPTLLASTDDKGHKLVRALGPWQLMLLGIGAIIGAGIFTTVGVAAAGDPLGGRPGAGPAIVLSFLLTALCCGFSALCYAEFASLVPVSGSAYTYAYATLGEFVAWIIGWDLIIEYGVGNAALAISWSGYFCDLLRIFDVHVPAWLAVDYRTALQHAGQVDAARAAGESVAALPAYVLRNAQAFTEAPLFLGKPFVFNLFAFGIVMAITVILVRGVRESAWFNSAMVVLKLAVVGFFILVGWHYVNPDNWKPFAPNGFEGIAKSAAILFFAYIGFDAISTASEEARNPQRDMPKAIVGSLLICTVLYVLVGIVLTGLVPWQQLGTNEPLSLAFANVDIGRAFGVNWAQAIIALGAVFATTSVLLVFALGQPRIFFSIARDGLLPQWAARVHPRYRTPHVTTILTGIVVAVISGVANLQEIVDLSNIGTLFAFLIVCIGVCVLRYRDPARPRAFRVPGGPWLVPLLGSISCIFLMVYLPGTSWWRFAGWLVLGMAVYFAYGFTHSVQGRALGRPRRPDFPMKLGAVGFVVLAIGLFVLPHDLSPVALLHAAKDTADSAHEAAVWGLLVSLGGLLVALGGLTVSGARQDDG